MAVISKTTARLRRLTRVGAAAFLLLSLCLAGCGKKKPPMPLTLRVPEPVSNLEFALREMRVEVSFTLPERYQDKSLFTGTERVMIRRAEIPFKDRDCPDCPKDFENMLNVSLDYPEGLVMRGRRALYVDAEVEPGYRYIYEVMLEGTEGGVSPSPASLVVDVVEPPPAPEDASGKYRAGQVSLTWSGVEAVEKKILYNIYRRDKGMELFSPVNETPISGTVFVDGTVQPEKSYTYMVRAGVKEKDTVSESAPSRRVIAGPIPYPRPPAPRGLAAIPRAGGVDLRWEPVKTEGLKGYRVLRSGGAKGDVVLTPTPIQETSYFDERVEQGAVYGYSVTTVVGEKAPVESKKSPPKEVFIP